MHRIMKKKVLLLQLLLLVERSLCSKVTTWKQVYINESFYDESLIKSSISTSSDITCSILATKSSSINLFCYDEGVCRLSNLVVQNAWSQKEGQDLVCNMKYTGSSELTLGPSDLDLECPEIAKEIGTKCYIIGMAKMTFFEAEQYCIDQGGFLAEPDATLEASTKLVTGLELVFATELQTILDIETNPFQRQFWLGLLEESRDGDFKYLKSGAIVSSTNPIVLEVRPESQEAITLVVYEHRTYKYTFGTPIVSVGRFPLCEITRV